MKINSRQKEIYDIFVKKKIVSVAELMNTLFSSESTIRRDLNVLENQGLIRRTHGGAVLIEGLNTESSIAIRVNEQRKEKTNIANKCIKLLNSNQTIFVDSSSTSGYVLPLLNTLQNITVITNGLNNATILYKQPNIRVYITGGIIYQNTNSVLGIDTYNYINNLNANVFIFSCSGISLNEGIMEASLEQSIIKQAMLRKSKIHILLVDHTKFGKVFMSTTGNFSDIDYLITDKIPSDEYLKLFRENNVKLIIADE